MTIIRFALLSTLLSCGKGDDGPAEDPEVGHPCDASFTLTSPDGEEFELDECKHHGVQVEYATMPDTTLPQPHNIAFVFRSTKNTNVNCWVRWEITRSCPDRTQYDLGGEDSQLTWNTTDCDVAESSKGEFEASYGSSEFTSMTSVPTSGLEEGSLMALGFAADVSATSEDGTTLDGSIVIDDEVPLVYTEFAGCSGSDGDADQDGSIGTQYGGDDCDDDDPTIGPHALEVCDEIDNNCDGNIDEDVTTTFYLDNDGDGYGQDAETIEACSLPDGYATYANDCDDENRSVSPDATEVCDGIDNDCDVIADEGTQVSIYVDGDFDGYGAGPPADMACPDSIPEGRSTVNTDCNDDNSDINPGAEEICDGIDNNCNDETDELPTCP